MLELPVLLAVNMPPTGNHNTALDASVAHLIVLFPGPIWGYIPISYHQNLVRSWSETQARWSGFNPCWLPAFHFLSVASNVYIFCTFYWRVQLRYMPMQLVPRPWLPTKFDCIDYLEYLRWWMPGYEATMQVDRWQIIGLVICLVCGLHWVLLGV